MQSKHELAMRLRKYILHCIMVHKKSASPVYKSMARCLALDRLRQLTDPDLPRMKSQQQIASIIIRHRLDLEKVLPVENNSSYKSSLKNLNEMLRDAYQSISSWPQIPNSLIQQHTNTQP